MAHSVGALLIPAPEPDDDESVGDPALDILAAYFKAVLTAWIGAAWSAVAPREPVVKTVYKHDPEEVDFASNSLPLLCVWRDGDNAPKRLADGYQETETALNILWVLPPATQFKNSRRHSFFSAFDKAISLAVINERDPSYIHEDDTADAAANAYGSDVQALAGIDWWRLQRITRVPVEVPTGDRVFRYPGYLATLLMGETTEIDGGAFVTYPTRLRATTTSGGTEPRDIQTFQAPGSFGAAFSSAFL